VAKSEVVEQAADELYALPPDEFTGARDQKAKELRAEGDREAANAVKALRKPTVAAAALNVLARSSAKEVERLLDAGEKLKAAQEELLSGGDREAFQRAAANERELVSELTSEAPAGLEEKVAATLHAAALDPELGEELRAGRLVREQEAIGGFGEAAAPGAPDRAPSQKPRRKGEPAKRPRASGRSREKADGAAKQQAEAAATRERLAAARTDERHARRELDSAERALEHARARADAAEAHAAEAAERAKTTADRLKEAKRAQAAARKAHERAARELEGAERAAARKS
jgi:hypothetical protein